MMEKLTELSKHLIGILLLDSKISEKLFENSADKSKYKICSIREDGAVIMGKTRFRFWNQLINAQDVFPFESFALKVWDALVDSSSGVNNTAIIEGLSHEIIMKSIRKKEYDWVVQRLFDCWRHVAQKSDGYQKAEGSEESRRNGQGRHMVFANDPQEIVLNIGGKRKRIPLVDAKGEPMHITAEVGIVDFYAN